MLNAYIYNGIRTPFGRNAGALAKVRPDNMMGAVIKEVVENSPFEAADIDDVNIGCGNQAGEDSRCVARHAVLLAGPTDRNSRQCRATQLWLWNERHNFGGSCYHLR